MSSSDLERPATGAPAVGNILGFSLLFRRRKALLALPKRGLAPGVRLEDYQAEIPDVEFPLRGRVSAKNFSQRRCAAVQGVLKVETRAVVPWLEQTLRGQWLGELLIQDVGLEIRSQMPGSTGSPGAWRVCLTLDATARDGRRHFVVLGFRPKPSGRSLALELTHRWIFGSSRLSLPDLLESLAVALSPYAVLRGLQNGGPTTFVVDVARWALTGPFVRAGWKAPSLERLGIEGMSVSRRGVVLDLRAELDDGPVPELGEQADPVGEALAEIHGALAQPDPDADPIETRALVVEGLERIAEAIATMPDAHAACVRWVAELSRFVLPHVHLDAVRKWIELEPNADAPRSLYVPALGRAGEYSELAHVLAAEIRSATREVDRARLELALATLLIERLDDPRTALAIAGPLVARLRGLDVGEREALGPDAMTSALTVLAQARAAERAERGERVDHTSHKVPGHVAEAIDDALQHTRDPRRRADVQIRVGRTLARYGARAQALTLLTRALRDDPDDLDTLELAIDLASELGDLEAAFDLLHSRLSMASARDREGPRRDLIRMALELDTMPARAAAHDELGKALSIEPDDPELLDMAKDLALRTQDVGGAAMHLARWVEVVEDPELRLEGQLELARLLSRLDRRDEAWTHLREALDTGKADVGVLELALEVAPAPKRVDLLDALIERASGAQRGRALVERAALAISAPAKLTDLWEAAELVRSPREVLAQIERLLTDHELDDLERLAELAQALQERGVEARAQARLGLALHAQGNDDPRAAAALERALELDPRRHDLEEPLGLALAQLGQLEPSLEHLREAADRSDPLGRDWERLTLHWARIAIELGRFEEAQPGLERLLDLADARQSENDSAGREASRAAADEAASLLFELHVTAGQREAARELARARAKQGSAQVRAGWLARQAELSEGKRRASLLEQAHELVPADLGHASALERTLTELGELDRLERLLAKRVEAGDDPTPGSEPHETLRRLVRVTAQRWREASDEEREALGGRLAARTNELLERAPDDLEALMFAAELDAGRGEDDAALEKWRLAATRIPADDPAFLGPALALGNAALRRGDVVEGRRFLSRAADLDPTNTDVLESLRALGRAVDDAQLLRRVLPQLVEAASTGASAATLELELAQACFDEREHEEGFAALERAAARVDPMAPSQRDVALRVLHTWRDEARAVGRPEQEATARARIRKTLGEQLELGDCLAEVELLVRLERIDAAVSVASRRLRREASAEALSPPNLARLIETLEGLDPSNPGPVVTALDAALESLEGRRAELGEAAGPLVEALARAVAVKAGGTHPHITLRALERVDESTALEDEFIERYAQAIASFDDPLPHLAHLDSLIVTGPLRPRLVAWLVRTVDGDELAAAHRLINLADRARPEMALELGARAFHLLRKHEQLLAALPALSTWVAHAPGPSPELRHALDATFEALRDGGSPRQTLTFVELWERALGAGLVAVAAQDDPQTRVRWLLESVLARHPDHADLHRELWARLAADPLTVGPQQRRAGRLSAARDALESIATTDGALDADTLATLAGALSSHLTDDDAGRLMLELAKVHPQPPVVRAAQHTLEARSRFDEWVELLERHRSDDPEPLERLAETASAAEHPQAAARALALAGLAHQRAGDSERAQRSLAASLAIEPQNPRIQVHLARLWAELDRPADALGVLDPLLQGEGWRASGLSFGELALESGRLALRLGQRSTAIDRLTLSLRHLDPQTRPCEEAREALFALYADGDEVELASKLAQEVAASSRDPAQRVAWLERGAMLATGRERARLLERMVAEAGNDLEVTDRLESLLRDLGDRAGLAALLRRRIHGDLARDDESPADKTARIEALVELVRGGDATPPNHDSHRELVSLYEMLLELDPAHADAHAGLLELAVEQSDFNGARTRLDAIDRLVELETVHAQPRVRAATRTVALDAHSRGDRSFARPLLERCVEADARDREAWECLAEIASHQDDAALGLRANAQLTKLGLPAARQVAVLVELAAWQRASGRLDDALTSLENAAGVDVDSAELHERAVRAWVARLEEIEPPRPAYEAKARAALRRAVGTRLTLDEALTEIELLTRLERVAQAIDVCIEALILHPDDDDTPRLRGRLSELCSNTTQADRELRALRRVVEALEPGPARAALGLDLARLARSHQAARTVLLAVDSIPTPDEEVLSLREWAIRSLGKVEDEVRDIEARLRKPPPDRMMVTRLLRMAENDAEACAARLLDLRERADESVKAWLAKTAFEMVRERAPARPGIALLALQSAIEDGELLAGPWWNDLALEVIEREDSSIIVDLLRVAQQARKADAPGFSEPRTSILERALVRFPSTPELHTLLLEQHGVSAPRNARHHELRPVLGALDDIVHRHALGGRLRGLLIEGLARAVDPEVGDDVLREQAVRFADEPEAFGQFLATLFTRRAWGHVSDLLTVRDQASAVDIDAWLELAQAAADGDDRATEARARTYAGKELLTRGEADGAVSQLRRAHELRPADPGIARQLGRALQQTGDVSGAYRLLRSLVDRKEVVSAGAELGKLAERCAELALELGRQSDAVDMLNVALAQSEDPEKREGIAGALFALLSELEEQGRALELARSIAGSHSPHRVQWLLRAADLSPPPQRAELLEQALALRPEDDDIAAYLINTRRGEGDIDGVIELLRSRIARLRATGDPTQLLGLHEELANLLYMQGDRDDEAFEVLQAIVRVEPNHTNSHLRLAELALRGDDPETAAGHWTTAVEQLDDDDPRLPHPWSALLGLAAEADDWSRAAPLLAREVSTPLPTPLLERLLDLAYRASESHKTIELASMVLERDDRSRSPIELHAKIGSAFANLGQPQRAAEAFAEAALDASDPETTIAVAQRWLRLTLTPEFPQDIAAQEESRAREALRQAMGDSLPAPAIAAEAELWSDRLGDRERAIELLIEGLARHPADDVLRSSLEARCESPARLLNAVDQVLDRVLADDVEARTLIPLVELALSAAHEAEEPARLLATIDKATQRVDGELELRETAANHREWAIKALGRSEEEIEALQAALEQSPNAQLVDRLFRMYDRDAQATIDRLLEIAGRLDSERAAALASHALVLGRDHAPERLDLPARAIAVMVRAKDPDRLRGYWDELEELAVEAEQFEILIVLFEVACTAQAAGAFSFDTRADRVYELILPRFPSDPRIHAAFVDRYDTPELAAEAFEDVVETLEIDRHQTVQAAVALAGALEPDAARTFLSSWAGRFEREESIESARELLDALLEADQLETVLERLLPAQAHTKLAKDLLPRVAARARELGSDAAWRRAALALGELELSRARRDEGSGDEPASETRMAQAIEWFEQAHAASLSLGEGDETPTLRWVARFGLADALAEAGRPDAALEHALPLLEALESEPGIVDPAHGFERLIRPAHEVARRSAQLLIAVSDTERASAMLERAFALASSEPRELRLELLRQQFELLLTSDAGEAIEARRRVAHRALDLGADEDRVEWLLRLARNAEGDERLESLRQASERAPDDPRVLDAYERELSARGEPDRLAEFERLARSRFRIALAEGHDDAKQRAMRVLEVVEMRSDVEGGDPATFLGQRIDLYNAILRIDPEDADARLGLGNALAQRGDDAGAMEQWVRAGELMPHDDDRFFAPARAIARHVASQDRPHTAVGFLRRALDIRPGDQDTHRELLSVAADLGDGELVLECAQALLEHGDPDVADLEASCGWALRRLGRPHEAHQAYARAAQAVEPGSEDHFEIARAWLTLVQDDLRGVDATVRAEAEAAARGHLRLALGTSLPSSELRMEAAVLSEQLGRTTEAIELVEMELGRRSGDELLLSTFKDLCYRAEQLHRYARVLESILERVTLDEIRDRLAIELAYTAVDLDEPSKVLETLERVSPAKSADPELLDLREWSVRALGRVEDELGEIESSLLERASRTPGGQTDEVLLSRLIRMLDNNVDAAARRLLELASRSKPPVLPLAQSVLEMIADPGGVSLSTALEAAAATLRCKTAKPLQRHYASLEALALAAPDADGVADLLTLGMRALSDTGLDGEGPLPDVGDLERRVDTLAAEGLRRFPAGESLHRYLWKYAPRDEDDTPAEAASRHLARLVDRLGLRGEQAARAFAGLAELLERSEAATLLGGRAEQALAESDQLTFAALINVLEHKNHWPEVMRLLELRVESATDDDGAVAALKHLAHIRAEVLGDAETAIKQLERALDLAPRDPDLLLPLLDHHYAQRDLGRAIELSERVLEHVPMGEFAFVALGHRAADAALAHGDQDRAESLLRRILARVPGETRTASRIAELAERANDPSHRVAMLGAIAQRQTGSARTEALEERARLLVEQLQRFDDAIEDLETVMEEGSPREGTVELLESLYSKQGRWPELVALLERDYSRRTGLHRSETLYRIGETYHEQLYDLPKAQQAFRLALETLGVSPGEQALADRIHLQLVAVLEAQGRYSELADHLERELTDELGASLDLETGQGHAVPPARVELLTHLARVHRTYLEDEARAAFVYEQLEVIGQLPDEGLATLARWYRTQHRHEDLVRILNIRARALASAGDVERKAELDRRIADILEGPLRRPHEAARHYLDAYLANPEENHDAGSRARVLLAGTDSVQNVRKLLLERIEHLTPAHRPYGLSLLGDLLAPQESFEEQAEQCYRLALEHERDLGSAREGLGRLLARQGRLEEAVDPLVGAAHSPTLSPSRAADAAATAARVLLELDRASEAENVLRHALGRAPDAERALLELARLYSRVGQAEDEAAVLDDLSELSLSSLLRAEVAFRRAMLLERKFRADPLSEAGEQARGFLLEAVGADAMHAQARQVLLELATARSEWSIVAHMHFLSIRELQPGTQRALTHLDLAEVYLDRLHDSESATRNLTAALAQPADELIIEKRGGALAERLPAPRAVAERLENTAHSDREATEPARARLLLFAAQLRIKLGEFDEAAALLRRVLESPGAPDRAKAAAKRRLDSLSGGDFELHQQRDALLSLLEEEEHDAERLHILSRLRDVGRSLEDGPLVERCGRDLIELAHSMLREGQDEQAASAALRDLFAERGDFRSIVELYEDLASRSGDPKHAAHFLTDAAGFAWAGVRDPELSIAILRRAIALAPDRHETLGVLADIAAQIDDRALDQSLCAELGELEPQRRAPRTTLVLAQAAHRLGRDLEAETLLRDLVRKPGGDAIKVSPDVELAALSTLEEIYARAGQARERLPVLARRAILLQTADRQAARGAQLELVRAQRDAGDLNAALDACELALDNDPRDIELTHLYAELLEDAEDWARLGSTLARLADIHTDPASQAHWLTRAARVRLDHAEDGVLAMSRARKLLRRACEAAPQAPEPRSVLLPVAFAQRRFDEVLDLTVELRALVGDDDESLLFGALVEALVHGRRTVARNIGARHSREVRSQILWPALTQVLEVVAQEGPLGRLDAVLGAASSLASGSEAFFGEFSSWAAGSPPRAGLCLGLARLHEAFGRAAPSRYLYQLAAFMAPHGPVVALVSRLPDAVLPDNPLQDLDWVPLSWRGVLREVLIQLRGFLAGVRGPSGSTRPAENAIERATVQSAGRVVAKWREPLGISVPIRFSSDRMHAGIGLHNELEPLVVVNESFITLTDAEQAVRLALSAGAIASGLAIVADVDPLGLDDLLDALRKLTLADHVPESRPARHIADALAARGLRAGQLGADLRNTLSRELEHWLDGPGAVAQLIVIIRRALLALATRLSGRLDGALLTLARDQNLLDATDVPDVEAVLQSEDARWLLRTLDVLPS